jgi:hypothetical protein
MVATAFFENVSRHRMEGRELREGEKEDNVILEFRPRPAEVAAAGHDRCIIPFKRESVGAWLDPKGDAQQVYSILDDRWRPYYEHRLAA